MAEAPPMAPPPAVAPNMTMAYPAYPPPQQDPRPRILEMQPDGTYAQRSPGLPQMYQNVPPADSDSEPQSAQQDSSQSHYLIAFKDHTVYTAVAYWFEGDTLHYFTNGNTHNQVSVSLIDRALTERLNREMGIDFRVPPAK